jgi:hypothetical protein
VNNHFADLVKIFKNTDFSLKEFPYLTHSTMIDIGLINEQLKDKNESDYFLILIINHFQEFKKSLKSLFTKIITENQFGISNSISQSNLEHNVSKSCIFHRFIEELVKWYLNTEFTLFNLKLLDIFKGVKIPFNDKSFSLEKNYGFSLHSFAKKNFLKLTSYLITQLGSVVGFGGIDYAKLGFLLLSSFTCGISMSSFFKLDIGLVAFSVSIILTF